MLLSMLLIDDVVVVVVVVVFIEILHTAHDVRIYHFNTLMFAVAKYVRFSLGHASSVGHSVAGRRHCYRLRGHC